MRKIINTGILYGILILIITHFCYAQGESKDRQKVFIRIAYPAVGTLINGQVGQVLERTNILAKNGLKGEIIAFQYGPPMMEALLSGKIDVALTSEQNVVVLLSKGFPARLIASLGSAGRAGLLVSANSIIESIEDLKGKKVTTIFGSSIHRPILVWLKEADLVAGRDVELINMQGGESRIALLNGSVDAIMNWDPYIEDIIQKKKARLIREQPLKLAVIMAEDFIQRNPQAVIDFLVALKEAALYMATHKTQVNNWYSQLSRLDPELIDRCSYFNSVYSKAKTIGDVDISLDEELIKTLEDIADFLYEYKLTDKRANIQKGIDSLLIREAEEKLRNIEYDPSRVKIIKPSKVRSVSW